MNDYRPRIPHYSFDEPVTFMQMWSKTKYPKWQFWRKNKFYMLVGTGEKLWQIDPDTDQIIMVPEIDKNKVQ